MDIHNTLSKIRATLMDTFGQIDHWFDVAFDLQNYRPLNGGWTIREVLEHIALTSHFLLKLIDKGGEKALKNINGLDLKSELAHYRFETIKLDEIGVYQSFPWVRPEHMEPTGTRPVPEIRQEMKDHLARCLAHLDNMPNGEGILYKTTMTVNDLGKIDVYSFIYFLAKHAERHIAQMERNKNEFNT